MDSSTTMPLASQRGWIERVRRPSLRPSTLPSAGQLLDSFVVRYDTDRIWAARRAMDAGSRVGLGRQACAEVGVIVSELVTNAVKFAGAGTVQLYGGSQSMEVVVEDAGPGLSDPENAVVDGYSEGAMRTPDDDPRGRRGLGAGLGAVKRLADELVITRRAEGGTRVKVVKRARIRL